MNETMIRHEIFERKNATFETERKFLARDPEMFEQYRPYAEKEIVQVYLSRPQDEYGLRVRQTTVDGETSYTATLKDRGVLTDEGLRRLEVEIPISRETFDFYAQPGSALIRKTRAEPLPGVTIDWIDGLDAPLIEIENTGYNEEASRLLSLLQLDMREVTGSNEADNESLAYRVSGIEHGSPDTLDVDTVLGDIRAFKAMGKQNIVVGLAGRSGSGKTTFTRQVAEAVAHEFGGSPIVVSTDDYHVGKTHLESHYQTPWTNWDLGVVYDTAELARDIERLQRHEPVRSRAFDFATQEPVKGRRHIFDPIVIVEGIHAGSRDLASVRDIFFEVPTSFATSMGRDIARLLQDDRPNDSIGTPEDRLRYMLETGEPTYRTFERPRRNRFSASVRALGSTALAR